jgi:hypothetical protein
VARSHTIELPALRQTKPKLPPRSRSSPCQSLTSSKYTANPPWPVRPGFSLSLLLSLSTHLAVRTLPAHSPSPVPSTSLNLTSISTIFRFDIFNELMPFSPCSDSINTFSTHLLSSPHSYISYPPPLAPLSYTLTNQPLQHPFSTPQRLYETS